MARIRLRELADERGYSMSDIQRRTGVSFPLLRRYWYNSIDGKHGGPRLRMISLDALDRFAALFGVQPGELIGPDGPSDAPGHLQRDETHHS